MAPKQAYTFIFESNQDDQKKQTKSAINTHVAYRAHERRRQKKNQSRRRASDETSHTPETTTPKGPKSWLAGNGTSTEPASPVSSPNEDSLCGRIRTTSSTVSESPDLLAERMSSSSLDTSKSSLTSNISVVTNEPVRHVNRAWKLTTRATTEPSHSLIRASTYQDPLARPTSEMTNDSSSNANSRHVSFNRRLNDTSLDPFIVLPVEADASARSLIRHWFTDAQTPIFGTSADAPYCPLRDWCFQNVQSYEIAMQWILIAAEQHITSLRGQPLSTSLYRRRIEGYKALNGILNNGQADLDKAYVGIIMAIVADSLLGKQDVVKTHVRGLDILLRERGGIHELPRNPLASLPPFAVAMQYTYAECPIALASEFGIVRPRFVNVLRSIYQHTSELRSILRRVGSLKTDRNADAFLESTLVDAFTAAKKSALDSSCVGSMIRIRHDESASYFQMSGLFSILFSLGLTLLLFGHRYSVKTVFLERLQFVAEDSSAFDSKTGKSLLVPAQLSSMISYVRQEVWAKSKDRESVTIMEIEACAATVDALKVFATADCSIRTRLMELMRRWLLNDEEEGHGVDPDHNDLSGSGSSDREEIEDISADLLKKWSADNQYTQLPREPVAETGIG